MLYGIVDVHFFFFFFLFFSTTFVRAISLEPSLVETPDWVCCLVLQSNFALLLTIQFASLFFFLFFCQHFVRAISLEPLLAETPNWVCCLVLRSNFALLLTIQLASLFYFFFCHDFVRAISLEPLLAESPNWVCCLVLRSNFALLLTIQFASIFFFFFSCHDFVRRRVFHLRGIAPRSHTGRPRTCLVLYNFFEFCFGKIHVKPKCRLCMLDFSFSNFKLLLLGCWSMASNELRTTDLEVKVISSKIWNSDRVAARLTSYMHMHIDEA